MIRYTDEYIEQLLSKFMNGESTLEEEARLGDYFRTQDVKPEWETYRTMFAYFDNGMKETFLEDKPEKRRGAWRRAAIVACIAVACCTAVTLFHRNETGTETARTEAMEEILEETGHKEIVVARHHAGPTETTDDESAGSGKPVQTGTTRRQAKKRRAAVTTGIADKDVKQAKEELLLTQEEIKTAYREIANAFHEVEETDMEIQAALAETCNEYGGMADVNNDLQIKNNIRTMNIQ